MKKITLRKRFIAVNILSVVITFFLFFGVTYFINKSVSTEISNMQLFMLNAVKSQIDSHVLNPIMLIENVDSILQEGISADSRTVSNYLENIIDLCDYFSTIYLIDDNGLIINSAPFDSSIVGEKADFKYYYNEPGKSSSIKWSEVYISNYTGNPLVQLSKKFDSYTIIAEFNLNEIPADIASNKFFNQIKSINIVDKYGTYILTENSEKVINRNKFEGFELMENAYKAGLNYFNDGDKLFFARNEGLGWYLILEFYTESLYSELQVINLTIITIWLVFTLLLVLILSGYFRKFNQEITMLKTNTKKIAEGDYTITDNDYIFSELRELKDDFDYMIGIIVSRENDIVNINSELEEKIANSTASLIVINENLSEQIKERRKAEAAVLNINRTLDKQVTRRTKTLKLINDKLRDSIKTQKAMEKTKNTFFAMMNHEMRTPLNGIVGFIQLLEMEELNEEQADMLGNIKNSAIFLQKIINNILDYTKYETDSIILEHESFDLEQLMKVSIVPFKLLAQEKGLKFNMEISSDSHEKVSGDRTKLTQIINNLLSNSLKFTLKGFINVIVSINKDAETNKVHLKVAVKDSGIGISDEDKKKIFKPFSQGHKSSTRDFEGSGLGLAISQKIANKMNGNISFESTPNIGSTFSFDAFFDYENSEGPISSIKTPKLLANYKALIADENLVNLEVLLNYLTENRINYDIALNQKDAIDLCRKENYDIIFIDLMSSHDESIPFSMKIRKAAGTKTKIVAVSSKPIVDDLTESNKNSINIIIGRKIDDNQLNALFSLEEEIDLYTTSSDIGDKMTLKKVYADILKNEVGFDDETSMELIDTFILQANESFQELENLFQEGENSKIILLLHKLKGAAGVIRAEEIRKMIELAETLMKKGKVSDAKKIMNNVREKKLFDSREAENEE
ncbi:MAG: Hpt domain-containing protein [Clostridia bacterium]|nr:Hpt domain-containing protein [Clostridia bacterium]